MSIADKATLSIDVKSKFSLENSALSEVDFNSNLSSNLDNNYELDVLSQFKANLNNVEVLSRRLKFVLGEVGQLMKKN